MFRSRRTPLTVSLSQCYEHHGAKIAHRRKLNLVHYLFGQGAGVEVSHETCDLVAFDLQDAHAVVGDGIALLGALGGPLQGGVPRVVGEDVAELGLHLVEGLAVVRPELSQTIVATKGLRDRDVTDAAILRVDPDERLYVPVFFELPQGLDKLIRNLFRHGITPLNIRICLYIYRFEDRVSLFPR